MALVLSVRAIADGDWRSLVCGADMIEIKNLTLPGILNDVSATLAAPVTVIWAQWRWQMHCPAVSTA